MKRKDLKGMEFTDGGDIDLDTDDHGFVGDDGARLAEADMAATAEQLAERTERVRAQRAVMGRPSLSAPGTKSPTVNARVPQQTKDALVARAEAEGVGEAVLVRRALEEYLAAHGSADRSGRR